MVPAIIGLAAQLLPLLGAAAPALGRLLGGDKGEEVATTIVETAEVLTGGSRERPDEIIDALKADPNLVLQFQTSMMQYQFETFKAEIQAQRDVIIAEANSESWITRNWRPLTMLVFVGLVTNWWVGGPVAPNLTEAMILKLLDIVQYGLSGYVVGRSAEKIAPMIMQKLKRKGGV